MWLGLESVRGLCFHLALLAYHQVCFLIQAQDNGKVTMGALFVPDFMNLKSKTSNSVYHIYHF